MGFWDAGNGNNPQGQAGYQGMPQQAPQGAPMQQPMSQPQGTPITPGKTISIQIKTEVGVELESMMGKETIVPNGVINVIPVEGAPFRTEQEVMGKIYQTVVPEAKAFILKIKEEEQAKGTMLGATSIMMRDKEFAPVLFPKLEALGLQVRTDISRISFRESDASKAAKQQARAEREKAEEAKMASQLGGAEQYDKPFVIFEKALAPVGPLPTTKVDRITAAFSSVGGTATLAMRDAKTKMTCKIDMSGTYTVDMTKFEPDYYEKKLLMMADMVVMNINMQLMNLRDVPVLDLGSKADEIAQKAAEALRDSGDNVLEITIGSITMDGKEKMKLDSKSKQMELASDPAKMAAQMQAAMEAARQQQLANWKAQGLTPLQGAAIEAEKAKKMFGPKYPDGSEVNAVNFLKNTGYPKELWEGADAGAASAAPQASAPAAPAQAAAPQMAARPKFCMNCGKPLPPTGAFCQECGTRI
ncbi:MAG: zinc ribbon domain-containing protein [Clostridiales bacterium]|nr:zinc ribbon domain-containing protein [Clostridiales bacterium]